jgi:D-alanyl-lipoteichoic acid acyltransferase DltB (MBOAT superfamily)
MIFHSFEYLIFFTCVFAVYWMLRLRWQNLFLLGASYFFYGYIHPWFLILLTGTALIDYFTSNAIERDPEHKKRYLLITLISNFGVLCAFKYLDFFTGGHALQFMHWLGFKNMTATDVARLLPVGLSFYTFQSVSYVVDVYRGEIKPQRNLLTFLLFVSFFPQLVAGPIQRGAFLASQLVKERVFDARVARGAVVLVLWGFFKKLAIADNAALVCNKVFSLENPSFPVLWAGVFAFAIQIFADFSAYTDIARGSARLLGIDIARNFEHPYFSASPTEFWRRWHISLSSWFRDYVYIPLGGSRAGNGRAIFNLMLTFLLSGLWHGASWNFILWGGYHGLLLVLWRFWERGPERLRPGRFWRWPQVLLTFVLVNIGWLMFRETNVSMLLHYFTTNPLAASHADWQAGAYLFVSVGFYAWPLALHYFIDQHLAGRATAQTPEYFGGWKWAALQAAAASLLLLAIGLLSSPASSDFIYFQF